MENLLCNESWLSGPRTPVQHHHHHHHHHDHCHDYETYSSRSYVFPCNNMTEEDFKQALSIDLQKEINFMPEPGYVELLHSKGLINARFRAIHFLIKFLGRSGISFITVFSAANYLDRFISASLCNEWKYWMVELLSISCLSASSKFTEVSYPSLHEIQMDSLEHSFHPTTIQQMELILLKALDWRLGATTSYSFFELLISQLESSKYHFHEEVITRVTDLLLEALLDFKMVEYRPSIVAASALRIVLEELVPPEADDHLACITKLFDEEQKDNLDKCCLIMKSRCVNRCRCCCPSSPVTVLLEDHVEVKDHHHLIDLSLFQMPPNRTGHESNKKRRRVESD